MVDISHDPQFPDELFHIHQALFRNLYILNVFWLNTGDKLFFNDSFVD